MTTQILAIEQFNLSSDVQARVQLDWLAVDEYAHAMRDGVEFPPVVVYFDGETYWLADGFHRITAARNHAKLTEFPADVRLGTKRDAQWFALGANKDFGVRRFNGDLKKIAKAIFYDPEWFGIGQREIARHTGIAETTLRRWFIEFDSSAPAAHINRPATVTATRNGRTYEMNIAAIGRRVESETIDPVPVPVFKWTEEYEKKFENRPTFLNIEDPETLDVETLVLQPDEELRIVKKSLPLAAANHAVSDNPDYDGDEWYTPATYIEAARSVMGAIDLDPATSAAAQEVVKAATWYTKQDDGLAVPWEGRVWINPPYSMPLIRQFTSKLIDEYENGNVTQAIILTNNSSDTAWFHDLLSHYPACFTRGRVQFWRPDHDAFGARQGQVLFYLGDNIEAFTHVFCAFGQVVQRI